MRLDYGQVVTILIAGDDDQTVSVHGNLTSLQGRLIQELVHLFGSQEVCVGGVVHDRVNASTLTLDDLLELADDAWSEAGVRVQVQVHDVSTA